MIDVTDELGNTDTQYVFLDTFIRLLREKIMVLQDDAVDYETSHDDKAKLNEIKQKIEDDTEELLPVIDAFLASWQK